jgi:predicted flavoprotein YhiN
LEVTMTASETLVREFAAQFPTPNVAAMVRYAEAGVITWAEAEGIAVKALEAGLAEVRS